MDIKQKFENIIKTAQLYQGQGLYREARKAYESAFELVDSNSRAKNRDAILSDLTKKIKMLTSTTAHVESAPATHELPDEVQNLIKNLFSFSEKKDPDKKALIEAVTLAKFGQIERAVEELTVLLESESVRVVAAKNIIHCHMLMSAPDRAMAAYEEWASEGKFPSKEIESIRNLLEHQLIKKGIQKALPKVTIATHEGQVAKGADDGKSPEMIDIGSVLINFDQGPLKGEPIELDVNFQTGNTISLMIESREKKLLDTLSIGFRLREVQFRSSVAIFRSGGVVSAKIKVHEGPKKGNYHLDVKVQDT
jgi:hypothetical protein